MNLKESAKALGNEGEANAAAAGITRLLMEYNLTEEDIPEQERLENPVVSEEIPYKVQGSTNGRWYADLVAVVCKYNLCRGLIISYPVKGRMTREKFQIVGRKRNVEVILYLISFLAHHFTVIGRREYPKYKMDSIRKYGLYPQGINVYMKSFLLGCVAGLMKKLEESNKSVAQDMTSLVKASSVEIDDFLSGMKIKKSRNSKESIHALAAERGIEVGKNVEIVKGIHAEKVCGTIDMPARPCELFERYTNFFRQGKVKVEKEEMK